MTQYGYVNDKGERIYRGFAIQMVKTPDGLKVDGYEGYLPLNLNVRFKCRTLKAVRAAIDYYWKDKEAKRLGDAA